MFKLFEFYCEPCEQETGEEVLWEDLVDKDEVQSPCPVCKTISTKTMLGGQLAQYSIADGARKAEILAKRSMEHTQKQIIEKEPEKFGSEGVRRAREGKIRVAGGLEKKSNE